MCDTDAPRLPTPSFELDTWGPRGSGDLEHLCLTKITSGLWRHSWEGGGQTVVGDRAPKVLEHVRVRTAPLSLQRRRGAALNPDPSSFFLPFSAPTVVWWRGCWMGHILMAGHPPPAQRLLLRGKQALSWVVPLSPPPNTSREGWLGKQISSLEFTAARCKPPTTLKH